MFLGFLERIAFLFFVHDGVAAEHRIGSVPGNLHGDGLMNASGDHISGCRAAQVMEQTV